jgi:hypothetical protein
MFKDKKVPGVTYWPEREIWVEEFGVRKLNYWRPSGVTPAPGAVDPFLDHIRYMFPNEAEAKILLQYLAHQVQHPGEKVHWAALLQGDQGNGKSYFATVMRTVLGPHNVRMVSNEELHETYTGWKRNTQLVVVEEMMAKGRLELMNKLKADITESWCTIREMYRPPYEQPNRFNFLMFTNHSDALILDKTDRRYCVLKSNAKPHPSGNTGYYAPLFEWTRRNGPALLDYLKKVDLSDFAAKAHAPMTEGKRAMIGNSMLALDRELFDSVEAMEPPFDIDLVRVSDLPEVLRKRNLNVNSKQIDEAFGRLGYLNLGQPSTGEGRSRIWAVRNAGEYAEFTPIQAYRAWVALNAGSGTPTASATAVTTEEAEEWLAKQMVAGNLAKNRLPM